MFKNGDIIKTIDGGKVVVEKYLGGGGQGDVYFCKFNGETKVLKWYKNLGSNPNAFRKNLIKNYKNGSPNPMFLWPLAVTEVKNNSFGYVMNLVDKDNYFEVSEYLLANVVFNSYVAAVEACINIVHCFRIIHRLGMSYKDLNDGNFFINPRTGAVLIGDNDNVSPDGEDIGIYGKPRYVAPELVRGDKRPDGREVFPTSHTDRFSLAIILFMILCTAHPLEGKAWASITCMSQKNTTALYGTNPVFIFDPKNKINEATTTTSANAMRIWPYLPTYIKDLFLRVFSKDTMIDHPDRRPTETDWLKALCHFRSNIIKCPCGNEVFYDDAHNIVCDRCKKKITPALIFKFPDYSSAVVRGMKVYRVQLQSVGIDDALKPLFRVVPLKSDPSKLFLDNISNQNIIVLFQGGHKDVQPGTQHLLAKGQTIVIYGVNVPVE